MATADRYPLVQYLKFEKPHLDEIKRTLRAASKQVEANILASSGGNISARVTLLQLEAQKAAINAALESSWDDMETAIGRAQSAAASAASQVVSKYENTLLSLAIKPDDLKALATSEAQRAASGIDALVTRELSSKRGLSERVYKTQTIANKMVSQRVNEHLAMGSTWKQFAKDMEKYISPDAAGGVSYAAQRLARTEINNAAHAATIKRYKDGGIVEKIDWHLSSSHPDDDDCDKLAAEGPYDVESVPGKPHPFCFCYLTGELPSEDEFMKKLLSGGYDDGTEPWYDSVDEDVVEKSTSKMRPKMAKDYAPRTMSDMTEQELRNKIQQTSMGYPEYGSEAYNTQQATLTKLKAELNDPAQKAARLRKTVIERRAGNIEYEAESRGISVDEFKKTIAKNLQKFVDGNDMAITVPGSKLSSIIDSGVQSVFSTGKRGTGGAPLKKYLPARQEFEEKFFGYPADLPAEERPVSAYVRGGRWKDDPRSTAHYGDTQIILKDSTKSRATVTSGDSLDTPDILPSNIDNVDIYSVPTHQYDDIVNENWNNDNRISYVETQIHGGVTPDEISEVIFSKEPTPAIKKKLDKLGIKYSVTK